MPNTFAGPIVVVACALQLLPADAAAFADYASTRRIRPFSSQVRRVPVPAGPATVIVRGNGDTELDCWVYDRSGTLLARDLRRGDVCEIELRNPASGELTIRINNYGDLDNRYELRVEPVADALDAAHALLFASHPVASRTRPDERSLQGRGRTGQIEPIH